MHAFHRTLELRRPHLERAINSSGDVQRLGQKLIQGQPVTLAAIGASNVVRGGCHSWQRSKCSRDQRYARGWLIQLFDALNATWPHPNNRLVNRGLMATGPGPVATCLGTYVPVDADAVIIGFADICRSVLLDSEARSGRSIRASTFMKSLESILRQLVSRERPPTLVFFNTFTWLCADATTHVERPCDLHESCDGIMSELAKRYGASVVSVRDALYRDAMDRASPLYFEGWTQDSGLHLTLTRGADVAAELLYHWVQSVEKSAESAARRSSSPVSKPMSLPRKLTTRTCYSFDDDFGGAIEEPRVLYASPNWTKIEFDNTGRNVLQKPGYVASRAGSRLVVSTLAHGAGAVKVGFLRTHRSHAVASVRCIDPCTCGHHSLASYRKGTSSTMELSHSLAFSSPPSASTQACRLELQLESEGEPFKFVSLILIVASGNRTTTSRDYTKH